MQSSYWKWQFKTAPYVFIAPFFICFMIFILSPFLYSIYLSFMSWKGQEKTFIGLDNYVTLLQSNDFWQAVLNSVIIFFLYVPLMLLLALLFAVCLSSAWMKWKGFFRTVFFIPNITSVVALSFVFVLIFNGDKGILNQFLMAIGVTDEPIRFFETPWWARVAVAVLVIFRWTGYNMILLLGGLQSIPKTMYEAARVDGANGWQSFCHITIPMMRRLIAFCTILSTIGTFSLFTEPFILTGGGPNMATTTPVVLIYKESFQNLNMGYASTISLFFFVLMMIIALVQLKLFRDSD